MGVDEIGVDEVGVDEMVSRLSGTTPFSQSEMIRYLVIDISLYHIFLAKSLSITQILCMCYRLSHPWDM